MEPQTNHNSKYFNFNDNQIGQRLDVALSVFMPEVSRNWIQKNIKNNNILVNNHVVKPNYRIEQNDMVEIIIDEPQEIEIKPQNIPLDILYEDEDILIVNKPKEMVVHPAPGHYENTLVNAIMYHCKDSLSGINGEIRPGIVHRIDQNTTGSLIICKNDKSHNDVALQMKEHTIKRIYYGIVVGNFKEETGIIDAPIGRSTKDRKKMAIQMNGKNAVTHYKVIDEVKGYSLVEFQLETGRTHQIRVHMSSIQHALLGDELYGMKNNPFHLTGQTLHASIIGLIHPSTREYIEFKAPLPTYFKELCNKLGLEYCKIEN